MAHETVVPARLLVAFALCALLFSLLRLLLRRRLVKGSIAFFHPFTSDGGGGERVLWCAIRAVQVCAPHAQVYLYTGDSASAAELCARAETLFGVPVLRPVQCVRLRWRALVVPERYPVLTLAGQALGCAVLGAEALLRLTPELFVDTSGAAFAYPLAAALGCKVVAYVHYPFVSSDMLAAVGQRQAAFNNARWLARSPLLSSLKRHYYAALAIAYGAAGRRAHAALCNSSWTEEHIRELWGPGQAALRILRVVYPPCNTAVLQRLPLRRPPGPPLVLSVAQFRPEKAHPLQLRAWARLLGRGAAAGFTGRWGALRGARLALVGGVRGEGDQQRLQSLRLQAAELCGAGSALREAGVDWEAITFHVGVPGSELVSLLGCAHAGLHTMRDEHFGISVVEYMAAGCVPVAHASAGPKADIVVRSRPGAPLPGRLAVSEEEYSDALEEILVGWSAKERDEVALLARQAAACFSEKEFELGFIDAIGGLLPAAPLPSASRERKGRAAASPSPQPVRRNPRRRSAAASAEEA